jgi:molybdopterin-guanine dinucleotide biosynthesis protein
MSAVFWPTEPVPEASSDSRYDVFASTFANCDVVLVEGDTNTTAPKIEVWRAVNETEPLIESVTGVVAIVTDDAFENSATVLPRSNVAALADFIHDLQR